MLLLQTFGFAPTLVDLVLQAVERDEIAVAASAWPLALPDAKDDEFLEVASGLEPSAVVQTTEACKGMLHPCFDEF